MKKNLKKALLAICCAALLVCVSIGATVAYLTSRTETVVNTFTVGQVKIDLDEAKVNANGNPINADGTVVNTPAEAARVKANSYKLLPGHAYTKDPTVTVKANSEESFVRMKVTVTFGNALTNDQLATSLDNIFTGYNAEWVRNSKVVSEDKKTITYEYRYNTTVSAGNADVKLEPLFTKVEVPASWTNEDLAAFGGITISIVAEAIQADSFNGDANAAWTAFGTSNT